MKKGQKVKFKAPGVQGTGVIRTTIKKPWTGITMVVILREGKSPIQLASNCVTVIHPWWKFWK